MPGGDLRAQLSRKRAERQSKKSLSDGVPSRLLQNALESAVLKKSKKRSKEKNTAHKGRCRFMNPFIIVTVACDCFNCMFSAFH